METTNIYKKIIIAGSVAICAALGFYLAADQLVPMADTALRSVFAPIPVLWIAAGSITAMTPVITGVAGGLVARKFSRRRPKPVSESTRQHQHSFDPMPVGTAA